MLFLPVSAVKDLAGMEASLRKVHGLISGVSSTLWGFVRGGMLFQKLRSKDKPLPHKHTQKKWAILYISLVI